MSKLDRRQMLKATGTVAALSIPLWLVFRRSSPPPDASRHGRPAALVPDPMGLCDLPAGFHYTVLESAQGRLSDGFRVPGAPDGMGCFAGSDGNWVLMRNHELDRDLTLGPFSAPAPREAYDPEAAGCVTRVVVDRATLGRISSNLVLCGTLRNCAGGLSPWGWLSCEESVAEGHGYVFLCPSQAASLGPPRKIAGYGRFNHEAVCIDPKTNIAYLTEDRPNGCLYRFVPTARDQPFEGHLQALAVLDDPGVDTGLFRARAAPRPATWVPLSDTDSSDDSLRFQALSRGAARVRRGEGIWYHSGSVYFSATSGGPRGSGQILRLALAGSDGGDLLEVVAESTDNDLLDAPDNLTVAPWGDVYIAEDGLGEQYVRCLTRDGSLVSFARNARSRGEFAGLCFSPDHTALFVNLQLDGLTLAIRGPFRKLGA